MIENDDEMIIEIDPFTRVTSVESKIDIAHLLSFHSMKQSKTHDYSNTHSVIELITSFLRRSITFSIVLSHDRDEQTVREGDYEAATIVNFSSVIVATPPSSK